MKTILELNNKELDKYSRQIMLDEIGYEGQLKLKDSKVCIVGSGGLGNPISSIIVGMGLGSLKIIDRDVIELSNLPRQTLFNEDDVNKVKVEVITERLKKLNPDCNIEALALSINENNSHELIRDCDIVIDGLDNVTARYALNKACVDYRIPFITGSAIGSRGQVFTILPNTACYSCLFPKLDNKELPTCSLTGVNPCLLSIVAGIQVSEAIKILLNKEPSLSKEILHIDLDNLEFNRTKTMKSKLCEVCF